MTTFLASIFVFGLLILFHELGHFVIAKKVGIQVHEFSMGFGPKLIGFHKGGTLYTLRLFPLGGFVRMAGMDPEEEEVEQGKGFSDKTIFQRASVIFSGPLMNFVLAALLLAIVFMIQGMPIPTTTIDQVFPENPAAEAGFQPGDQIVAIEGQTVEQWEQVSELISGYPETSIDVTVERNGNLLNLAVIPERGDDGLGRIGIVPTQEFQKQNPVSAIASGAQYTVQVTFLIFDFIGKMIFGNAPAELGGPVRIVYEIDRAADLGFIYLLQLAAFLSINLGLFNLFPIPALDGSRLLFLFLEWVRGKAVDPAKENYIHFIGFVLLLTLIVFITYNDILQIFVSGP